MKNQSSYSWSRRTRAKYISNRMRSLTGLGFRMALASRGEERQQSYDRVCDFMIGAGGVYTKFLQSVLIGNPEVQDWLSRRKVDFYENVPTEPLDIETILKSELGDKADRLQVSPEIIASGTFAQVYGGILDGYQPIIVKIQRRSIRPSLKNDVWLIRKFARYGRPFLTNLDADIGNMSRDFARITVAEMDYKREARLGEQLREKVGNQSALVIPKSYEDLSSEHVIVQDRLGGVSLAEYSRNPKRLSSSQKSSLEEMVINVLVLPFYTGLVHADPHPGNVRLLDDNRFALLDFGAIDEKPVDTLVYRHLLIALIKGMDGTLTPSEALDAYFAAYAPKLYSAIGVTSRALGLPPVLPMFAKMSLGSAAGQPQTTFRGIGALSNINKLVNPGNRFALKSSLQNVSYARAIHTLVHTMLLLDLQSELENALRTMGQLMESTPEIFNNKHSANLSVLESKEIVYAWLEKVIERNPLMARELATVFKSLQDSPTQTHDQLEVS